MKIHDDGDNLSDHLATSCNFVLHNGTTHNDVTSARVTKLQWDKADTTSSRHITPTTTGYETLLNQLLSNVTLPIDALLCSKHDCSKDLESYYGMIKNCISVASSASVPLMKIGVQKHWWTPDLDELIQKSP